MDDLLVCAPVRPCVGLSSALWKNGGSDPDAVWHRRSDGSRDEAGSGVWGSVHGKGYFCGQIWGMPLFPIGTLRRACVTVPRHGLLSKLLWADSFEEHTINSSCESVLLQHKATAEAQLHNESKCHPRRSLSFFAIPCSHIDIDLNALYDTRHTSNTTRASLMTCEGA